MMSLPKQSSIGPCIEFPFAFIATYSRSGATLAQVIINAIPDYCLRGKKYSMLFYLLIAVRQCSMAKAHLPFDKSSEGDEAGPRSPLFGVQNFDLDAISKGLVELFTNECLRPPEGTQCLGFKEVRYIPSDVPNDLFAKYLDFIQHAFPGQRLFLTFATPHRR